MRSHRVSSQPHNNNNNTCAWRRFLLHINTYDYPTTQQIIKTFCVTLLVQLRIRCHYRGHKSDSISEEEAFKFFPVSLTIVSRLLFSWQMGAQLTCWPQCKRGARRLQRPICGTPPALNCPGPGLAADERLAEANWTFSGEKEIKYKLRHFFRRSLLCPCLMMMWLISFRHVLLRFLQSCRMQFSVKQFLWNYL